MTDAQDTCWTMIESAARGDAHERERFAERYGPPLRAYFAARWRGAVMESHVEDATQVVFLECLKEGGLLSKASPQSESGFRAFLYGAARNIARRFESRGAREQDRHSLSSLENVPAHDETSVSLAFDRAWAGQMMKNAASVMAARAAKADGRALERVDLLRLRFEEGLPIRAIASRWNRPADQLHREYARARKEFKEALFSVIAYHCPGGSDRVQAEYEHLLGVLGPG